MSLTPVSAGFLSAALEVQEGVTEDRGDQTDTPCRLSHRPEWVWGEKKAGDGGGSEQKHTEGFTGAVAPQWHGGKAVSWLCSGAPPKSQSWGGAKGGRGPVIRDFAFDPGRQATRLKCV